VRSLSIPSATRWSTSWLSALNILSRKLRDSGDNYLDARRRLGIERETPRVTITVTRTAQAERRLGRSELRPFNEWDDGRPETELNFKFYRQATNKIGGISAEAAVFLQGFMRQ
jgi:hypothetical protein